MQPAVAAAAAAARYRLRAGEEDESNNIPSFHSQARHVIFETGGGGRMNEFDLCQIGVLRRM